MEIMKYTTLLAAGLAVTTTGAFAGGIDRSGQSISALFEDGNYLEFSFGSVSPNVSGVQTGAFGSIVPGIGQSSGNMAADYTQLGFAY
ncbi:MAG: hypothetical protein ACJAR9_001646, partial [Celeribacter sp.]